MQERVSHLPPAIPNLCGQGIEGEFCSCPLSGCGPLPLEGRASVFPAAAVLSLACPISVDFTGFTLALLPWDGPVASALHAFRSDALPSFLHPK